MLNNVQILIYRNVFYVHFLSVATENEPKERYSRSGEKDLPSLRNHPSLQSIS